MNSSKSTLAELLQKNGILLITTAREGGIKFKVAGYSSSQRPEDEPDASESAKIDAECTMVVKLLKMKATAVRLLEQFPTTRITDGRKGMNNTKSQFCYTISGFAYYE
jgi:hypothetical protein